VEFAYHLTVHNRQPTRFAKPTEDRTRSAGNDVRFTQATFDGRLRITDLDAFRRTLTQGLGKAKAYGCGLMTLAPVR
jgi:CRISPR system Cascade subunit CasE